MKKNYEEPELLVRNYLLAPDEIMTTSGNHDLNDGDDEDYFG